MRTRKTLDVFEFVGPGGLEIAVKAAKNFRKFEPSRVHVGLEVAVSEA